MTNFLCNLYRIVFARVAFFRFNKFLFRLSLHGLGILNYENDKLSGEISFLRNHLEEAGDGAILDVGANLGNYACLAHGIDRGREIYAFEPHPRTYARLVERVNTANIKTFNVGVGACAAVLTLYDYADSDGSEHASLHKGVIEDLRKCDSVSHHVTVVALDDFALEQNIERIALLKIDTEGHEFDVLKGAHGLLTSNRIAMIHLEFNEMNVFSRVFFKDIWDFLPNYDFFRMLPDGLVPIRDYTPVFCEIFAYQNIVAKLRTAQ